MENHNDEYPTAKILTRFASKPNVDVVEVKSKQLQARHDISQQARTLGNAAKKEAKRIEQLEKARSARSKKGGE